MHQLSNQIDPEAIRKGMAQAHAGLVRAQSAGEPSMPRVSALVENMGAQIDRIVAALMCAELGLDRLNGPQPMADVPGVATAPCISSLDRLAEKISHLAIIADSAEHLATRIDNIA